MPFKSLVVFVVILLALISAIVFSLRWYGVLTFAAPWEEAADELDATPSEGPPVAALGKALSQQPVPTVMGIEGLALRLSRPLMFDIADVRGLAATSEFLYVAYAHSEKRMGVLSQIHRDTYASAQVRVLEKGTRHRLGGIHVGVDGLWAPLVGDDDDGGGSSVILLLDPRSLEEARSFEVEDHIRAVAQGADGHIYGINEEATTWYEWDADGHELGRMANATATSYYDMEVVRGSLVCAGEARDDDAVGVVDVIDPGTFAILARHHCYARSVGHNWVTQGGFAFVDGVFLFLPDGGKMPMLMTYILNGVTLEEYVPRVGPP